MPTKKPKKSDNEEEDAPITFHTVIEEPDGALVCDCDSFGKNGKACLEVLVVRMQREQGKIKLVLFPMLNPPHPELETRKKRGKDAKGVHNVPKRQPTRTGGRSRHQARSDYTVEAEYASYMAKVERGWDPHKDMSDIDDEQVNVKTESSKPPAAPPNDPFSAGSSSQKPVTPPPTVKTEPSRNPDPPAQAQGPTYTLEEIEMLDIDLDRWSDPEYNMRADEISQWTELLNALVRKMRPKDRRGLFSTTRMPFKQKNFKVLIGSDLIDRLKTQLERYGSINAFPAGSVLERAWLHSQDLTLDTCLFFHHDRSRDHWLLFLDVLSTGKIFCVDPGKEHPVRLDVQNIRLMSLYFTPQGSTKVPKHRVYRQYEVRPAEVQQDSSSCGFWAVALAILWPSGPLGALKRRVFRQALSLLLCQSGPASQSLWQLTAIGSLGASRLPRSRVKSYLKAIWTSWRIEEKGLSTGPLLAFMSNWDMEFEETPDDDCNTITRHAVTSPLEDSPMSETFACAAYLKWGPLPDAVRQQMKNLAAMETQDFQLVIPNGRTPVKASDLRRFLDPQGEASDEIVNFFVDSCMFRPEAFHEYTHLEPPNDHRLSDYLVVSSFLYPKIHQACQIKTDDQEIMVAVWEPVMRWHSEVDFTIVQRIFVPIHDRLAHHWLLAQINWASKNRRITIYDSWPGNRKKHAAAQYLEDTPYEEIIEDLRKWFGVLMVYHELPFPDWSLWSFAPKLPDRIPCQINTVDCGFFMIFYILQLLHWGRINGPQTPPHLCILGTDMRGYGRLFLGGLFKKSGSLQAIPRLQSAQQSPMVILEDSRLKNQTLGSPIVLHRPITVLDHDVSNTGEMRPAFIEEMEDEDIDMPAFVFPDGYTPEQLLDRLSRTEEMDTGFDMTPMSSLTSLTTSPLPTPPPAPPLRRSSRRAQAQ
ncbi:hypothetical protein C8R44DRAFT_754811 [Mycena epipterygia]|nr:hypothetical protein C8R44DRAFT_754811 [Mycena epipterygia]